MNEFSENIGYDMYRALGISEEVYAYGEAVARELLPRFAEIDEVAQYNQV